MKKSLILLLLGLLWTPATAETCTQFRLSSQDKAVIVGRSLEFALNLQSALVTHPRGENKQSLSSLTKPGLVWTSKYGYLAINALGIDTSMDGINEQGLSIGALWMPNITQYQEVPPGKENQAVSVVDFGSWVLGNFSTVDEVKAALPGIYVWGPFVSQLAMVPPLHFSIDDANGKSIVVEFIGGEVKVYDNPNGVMTNYPTFDWHLVNLQNYVNLNAVNASPIQIGDSVLGPTGEGSGLLGIPGDWTPPSRFVRVSAFKNFAKLPQDASAAVNLANHLLNTVDIPIGDIRSKKGGYVGDYTQWVVIKDLTHRKIYFRTYENLSLRGVDLSRLNLNPDAPIKTIPLQGGWGIQDLTEQML